MDTKPCLIATVELNSATFIKFNKDFSVSRLNYFLHWQHKTNKKHTYTHITNATLFIETFKVTLRYLACKVIC